jgi:hypothetical protein
MSTTDLVDVKPDATEPSAPEAEPSATENEDSNNNEDESDEDDGDVQTQPLVHTLWEKSQSNEASPNGEYYFDALAPHISRGDITFHRWAEAVGTLAGGIVIILFTYAIVSGQLANGSLLAVLLVVTGWRSVGLHNMPRNTMGRLICFWILIAIRLAFTLSDQYQVITFYLHCRSPGYTDAMTKVCDGPYSRIFAAFHIGMLLLMIVVQSALRFRAGMIIERAIILKNAHVDKKPLKDAVQVA